MDNNTKQVLIAEVSIVKSMVSAAGGAATALNQTTFPVQGPVINIPTLAMAGVAFRQQGEAIEKLASLVEKLVKAS